VYWLILSAYVLRSAYRGLVLSQMNPGKDIVVVTTAVCWYAGIVASNSDYAFTGWHLGALKLGLAPLLAVPQITHYVLDGFIWRRKTNPDLRLL
jgi:hypothetical protein